MRLFEINYCHFAFYVMSMHKQISHRVYVQLLKKMLYQDDRMRPCRTILAVHHLFLLTGYYLKAFSLTRITRNVKGNKKD